MTTEKNQIKYGILGMLILFIALTLLNSNSTDAQDGYCFLTMTNGQSIPISASDNYHCSHTTCQVCVDSKKWYSGCSENHAQ